MHPNRPNGRQRDRQHDRQRHQDALKKERDKHVYEHDRKTHSDQAGRHFVIVKSYLDLAEGNALRQIDVAPGVLDCPAGLFFLAAL